MLLIHRNHRLQHFVPRVGFHGFIHDLVRAGLEIGGELVFVFQVLLMNHLMHWLSHGIDHLRQHFAGVHHFEIFLNVFFGRWGLRSRLLSDARERSR
jgi:hypothetical protein